VFVVDPKIPSSKSQTLSKTVFFPREKNNGSFRVSVLIPERPDNGPFGGKEDRKKKHARETSITIDDTDGDFIIKLNPFGEGSGRLTYEIPALAISGVEIEKRKLPLFAPVLEQIGQINPDYKIMAEALIEISKYLARDGIKEADNILRSWREQFEGGFFKNPKAGKFNNDLKRIANLKESNNIVFDVIGSNGLIKLKFYFDDNNLPTVKLVEPEEEWLRDIFDEEHIGDLFNVIKPGNSR